MSVRVSFVIVSHSASLAAGVCELAAQMAPDVHFEAAATAAEAGAAATEPLRATKGRASYLGERSIGHLDPGAVSTSLILRAAVRAAGEAGAA